MSLPIRIKIVLLLVVSLMATLVTYLTIGGRLMIEDKVSYLYDQNLGQVRSVAQVIENRVRDAHLIAKAAVEVRRDSVALKKLITKDTKNSSIQTLLLMRSVSEKSFQIDSVIGTGMQEAQNTLDYLGWTPELFKKGELIGTATSGKIAVGGQHAGITYIALLPLLQQDLSTSKTVSVYLIDSSLRTLSNDGKQIPFLKTPELSTEFRDLTHSLLTGDFKEGVREWGSSDNEYLVGYSRSAGDLLVLGLIQKSVAFSSIQTLRERSLILGGSLLLLAIGITLIFGRQLTRRLQQMVTVTQKVSEGDFDVRVPLEKGKDQKGGDEVIRLAHSFNAMAGKISDLMVETAEKARMEKEIETAQAAQKCFFPAAAFHHPKLDVDGRYLAATECAGDWWNYSQIGDHLIVFIGDVTGHGVSSALVTAAANGAYSLLIEDFKSRPHEEPSLEKFVGGLNTAITRTSSDITMTFFVTLINLKTGLMKSINGDHRPPYLYRNDGQDPDISPVKCIKPMILESVSMLGQMDKPTIKPFESMLSPGDVLFLYTDGIIEAKNAEGRQMRRAELATMIHQAATKTRDPSGICDSIIGSLRSFLNTESLQLEDDVTAVVISVH